MVGFPLITVPDPDEPEAAELFVDGYVGSDAYRFLLDTGAGRTFLKWSERNAHFPKEGDFQTSGIFREHRNELISIPSLRIGPLEWTTVPVARSQKEGAEGYDLIGMDLLKQHCLHFQFQRRWVEVLDNEYPLPEPVQDLIVDRAWHPYVSVALGESNAQAVWDTGASITVVDTAFVAANPSSFSPLGMSEGTDSSGKTMETPMMRMASYSIAGYSFPVQTVASVDLSFVNKGIERPMDMILGYNTLCKADWLFDFPNQRWSIIGRHHGA